MIVMKFGGSSLASPASIARVISIVRSEATRQPVVVASAMGDTTDLLLELLNLSRRRGSSSAAWKLQTQIKDQHFAVCDELLSGEQQSAAEQYLKTAFRDLHIRMMELREGELRCTPELEDWTLSLGEQLSSQLLAAVLAHHGGKTLHLDARKLIVTNDRFTEAQPLYWQTYARIRWSVPVAARNNLIVLGGFIGATEDGRTTTLGRGGSDLTASLVGAAINADEIQVWKDVDGMLTCDPRVHRGGHQVKRISYDEASELAQAGATILHPETMAPAKRLRIPIVIRNTFRPASVGTRIEGGRNRGAALVKSIAVRSNVTLLEVFPANESADLTDLVDYCKQHSPAASLLSSSDRAAYIAVQDGAKVSDDPLGSSSGCREIRMRNRQAVLTLVGQGLDKQKVAKSVVSSLPGVSTFVIPTAKASHSVMVAVPQQHLGKSIDLLHKTLFQNPDPQFFVASTATNSAGTAAKRNTGGKRRQGPKATAIAFPKSLPQFDV